MLYFLHSTLVLSFYIDVVFTLFINHPEYVALSIPISVFVYRCVVQERRNSIANGLKLRLSCTNPSMYYVRCIGIEMNSIKYFTYAKIITLIYPESGICVVYTNSKFSIGPFGTNFSEIWIEFLIFSFKKMCLRNGGHFVQEESLDKTAQVDREESRKRKSGSGCFPYCSFVVFTIRNHPGYGLGQWEAVLHSNASSNWLSPYSKWSWHNYHQHVAHPQKI